MLTTPAASAPADAAHGGRHRAFQGWRALLPVDIGLSGVVDMGGNESKPAGAIDPPGVIGAALPGLPGLPGLPVCCVNKDKGGEAMGQHAMGQPRSIGWGSYGATWCG